MNSEKIVRYIVGILLVIVAINAFGGGAYGLSGAKEIPEDWLKGTPFRNYIFPSLVLIIAVGGVSLWAAFTMFMKRPIFILAGYCSAVILLVWIITQVTIIGYVSWLQPAMFVIALAELILTYTLSKLNKSTN